MGHDDWESHSGGKQSGRGFICVGFCSVIFIIPLAIYAFNNPDMNLN